MAKYFFIENLRIPYSIKSGSAVKVVG